jgi:hypothetical protein
MDFELRDANAGDIDACMKLLTSDYMADLAHPEAMGAMWSEIARSKNGLFFLAADPGLVNRIVHFAVCVFVSDSRADEYHKVARPLIARRIVREWASGGHPFLIAGEIARANAGGGLNLVTTHYGSIRVNGEVTERVRVANYESARRALLGWNLRSYTMEAFGRKNPEINPDHWGASLGYRVRKYTREQLVEAGISEPEGPSLWTATRAEAARNSGYMNAVLFNSFTPPRCRFSPNEQATLQLALDGRTDDAIARETGISLATVKKRFRSIYEKALEAVPQTEAMTASAADGKRGAEVRRTLLNYVRQHPEELRPYAP